MDTMETYTQHAISFLNLFLKPAVLNLVISDAFTLGTPLLFVVPWVVAKMLKENKE